MCKIIDGTGREFGSPDPGQLPGLSVTTLATICNLLIANPTGSEALKAGCCLTTKWLNCKLSYHHGFIILPDLHCYLFFEAKSGIHFN